MKTTRAETRMKYGPMIFELMHDVCRSKMDADRSKTRIASEAQNCDRVPIDIDRRNRTASEIGKKKFQTEMPLFSTKSLKKIAQKFLQSTLRPIWVEFRET